MDQRYENGGQWVYYNGELYHAGVKGMQWGKHLPGTDWWKETTGKYLDRARTEYVPGGNKVYRKPTFGQKVVANIKTAGQAAKIYGRKARLAGKIVSKQARAAVTRSAYKVAKGTSKLWNQAKGFSAEKVKELSEFAKNAYSKVRGSVTNFLQKGTGLKDYIKQKASGSEFNAWLENAKQGVMIAANRYLEKIGMRKETESFITKKSNIPLSSLPKTSSLLPSEQKLIADSQNDINNIGKPGYLNRNTSLMSANDQVDEKLRKQGITIKR